MPIEQAVGGHQVPTPTSQSYVTHATQAGDQGTAELQSMELSRCSVPFLRFRDVQPHSPLLCCGPAALSLPVACKRDALIHVNA